MRPSPKAETLEVKKQIDVIKPNCTKLILNNGTCLLISYTTPVAYRNPEGKYFKTDKFWSNTTSKHISAWLNGLPHETCQQSTLNRILSEI